jgi:hypothetical protein
MTIEKALKRYPDVKGLALIWRCHYEYRNND